MNKYLRTSAARTIRALLDTSADAVLLFPEVPLPLPLPVPVPLTEEEEELDFWVDEKVVCFVVTEDVLAQAIPVKGGTHSQASPSQIPL